MEHLTPTLWRTCRVLANRRRLEILALFSQEKDLTVAEVAEKLDLSLPVASQSLRTLEARGLLTVQRRSRYVHYRRGMCGPNNPLRELNLALRQTFKNSAEAVERLFKLSTAFTHPRRVELFRVLGEQPRTWLELQTLTCMSGQALSRHLAKLRSRGFVVLGHGRYRATVPDHPVARALSRRAVEPVTTAQHSTPKA